MLAPAHRCGVCDAGGATPITEANAAEEVVGSAAALVTYALGRVFGATVG